MSTEYQAAYIAATIRIMQQALDDPDTDVTAHAARNALMWRVSDDLSSIDVIFTFGPIPQFTAVPPERSLFPQDVLNPLIQVMEPNPAATLIKYTTQAKAGLWLRPQGQAPPADPLADPYADAEQQSLTPEQQRTLDAYITAASAELNRRAGASEALQDPEATAADAASGALLDLVIQLANEAAIYATELHTRINEHFLDDPDHRDPDRIDFLAKSLNLTARTLGLQAETLAELVRDDPHPGRWQAGAGHDATDDYEDDD